MISSPLKSRAQASIKVPSNTEIVKENALKERQVTQRLLVPHSGFRGGGGGGLFEPQEFFFANKFLV